MSEWWTYGLRDLLLFSPRTYYRLFELYNRDIWPAQIVAVGAAVALFVLWRRGGARAGRAVAVLLALCWLWVAWAFHWQRYATINWAASHFAAAFALEAALLAWVGVRGGGGIALAPAHGLRGRVGLGLLLFAVCLQPLLAPLSGRPWTQVELFGLAPDPTALATIGIVWPSAGRLRWVLLVVPVLWCAVSAATMWAMAGAGGPP